MLEPARLCDTCRRHEAIGVIVDAIAASSFGTLAYLAALDAVADLLIERAELVRAHRRELFEEELEAQRGARDSYREGREGSDGW